MDHNPQEVQVSTESPGLTTIRYAKRTLTMRQVTDTEIDGLFSSGNTSSMHFGFLGTSVGTLLSAAIVLATVDLSSSPIAHATFVGLTWSSAVASAFFIISSVRAYNAAGRQRDSMKQDAPQD